MAYEIVKLTSPDQLGQIADEVFDGPIRPDYLAAFLGCPRHVMFLAVEDGEVIGMSSGVEYFHPDKPAQLWINEVGTGSAHRRKGVGRALTQALVNEAEARGCICAWLGTDHDNTPAQACFGSVPDGEPPTRFLLYEWDLEDDDTDDAGSPGPSDSTSQT